MLTEDNFSVPRILRLSFQREEQAPYCGFSLVCQSTGPSIPYSEDRVRKFAKEMLDTATQTFIETQGKLEPSVTFQPGRYKEGSTSQEADHSRVAISQVSSFRQHRKLSMSEISDLPHQVIVYWMLLDCFCLDHKYRVSCQETDREGDQVGHDGILLYIVSAENTQQWQTLIVLKDDGKR
jgi:hypothetical protein